MTSYDEVGPVGLTCQSVASVSLNPPLVLFCGGKNSTSLPRILATGRFCINILGDDHHEMAQQFAVSGTDKFARGDWRLSAQGMPQLEGAIAHIECTEPGCQEGNICLPAPAASAALSLPGPLSPMVQRAPGLALPPVHQGRPNADREGRAGPSVRAAAARVQRIRDAG